MKFKPEISIIVPFHNVEKYIFDCLKSIQDQTYRNYEVILVDDGSTDQSLSIVQRFCLTDNRFQLYRIKYSGVSFARNYGLDRTKGKYISFIDSDDVVDPNYLSKLYKAIINNQAEISICNYSLIDEQKNSIENKRFKINYTTNLFNGRDIISYILDKDNGGFVSIWNRLYDAKIFKALRFEVGQIHEDEIILFDVFWNTNRVVFVNEFLYFYMQRGGSIMHSKMQKKDIIRFNKVYIDRINFLSLHDSDLYQKAIWSYKSWIILTCLNQSKYLDSDLYNYFQNQYRKYVKLSNYRNLKVLVKDILGYINLNFCSKLIAISYS